MAKEVMKCNWLGKGIADDATGKSCFSLIVHPLSDLSDNVLGELASCAGLTRMDIRIRIQPQAWFFLLRNEDREIVENVFQRLSSMNIMASIFEDNARFEVPQPRATVCGLIEKERFSFLSAQREQILNISSKSKLLIVTASISISRHEEKSIVGYHSFNQTVLPVATHGSYSTEEKKMITDVYDLNNGICVRVAEPNFNFCESGFENVVSFREGHKALLTTLRKYSNNIVIDTRFMRSSLPYTSENTTKSQSTPYREGFGTIHRGVSSSDSSQRYEQYSRFIYITQAGKQ